MALCVRTGLFLLKAADSFFFLVPVEVVVGVGVWELRECSPDGGTGLRCAELPIDAGALLYGCTEPFYMRTYLEVFFGPVRI